jgi:hypothetical protein
MSVLLIVVGAVLATGGGAAVEFWRVRREGKAAGRVIWHELMRNGQVLSTFRRTGEWLAEPRDAAWLAYGAAVSPVLSHERWPDLATGYTLMGVWRGLSNGPDDRISLDQLRSDILTGMLVVCRFVGVDEDKMRQRYEDAEAMMSKE